MINRLRKLVPRPGTPANADTTHSGECVFLIFLLAREKRWTTLLIVTVLLIAATCNAALPVVTITKAGSPREGGYVGGFFGTYTAPESSTLTITRSSGSGSLSVKLNISGTAVMKETVSSGLENECEDYYITGSLQGTIDNYTFEICDDFGETGILGSAVLINPFSVVFEAGQTNVTVNCCTSK